LAVLEQEAKMPTFFNLDKKRKHEEQEEYDLVQMGKVDDAIMEREITIALGRNRFDVNFKNITGTFEQFLKHILGNFQQGEKDGQCILQGALVDNGGQRKAKSMTGNSILMLDMGWIGIIDFNFTFYPGSQMKNPIKLSINASYYIIKPVAIF
jgi:hypothetical protein